MRNPDIKDVIVHRAVPILLEHIQQKINVIDGILGTKNRFGVTASFYRPRSLTDNFTLEVLYSDQNIDGRMALHIKQSLSEKYDFLTQHAILDFGHGKNIWTTQDHKVSINGLLALCDKIIMDSLMPAEKQKVEASLAMDLQTQKQNEIEQYNENVGYGRPEDDYLELREIIPLELDQNNFV